MDPEGTGIGQDPKRDMALAMMLENRGYKDVARADLQSTHDIFFASKEGQECFIKIYKPRTELGEDSPKRADTELACYQNLPPDILVNVVEVNADERYLALEKVELEYTGKSEQMVEEFVELGLERFPQIDASFLPEVPWDYYEEIFGKMKDLETAGLIDDAKAVENLFRSKRGLIEGAKKGFSHQDFGRRNVQKIDGELKVFDFESARQDNAMFDMATLFIDIKDRDELVRIFKEKVGESEHFNEELLDLMIVRRATAAMHFYMSEYPNNESSFLRKNREIFAEKVKQLLSSESEDEGQ